MRAIAACVIAGRRGSRRRMRAGDDKIREGVLGARKRMRAGAERGKNAVTCGAFARAWLMRETL